MKKFFFLPLISLVFACVFPLISCNNVLDSSEFKDQLDKDIARAKETPFTVNIILANPIHGQLNTTAQKLKKGDSFELSFTVANGFIFEEWTCTDSSAIKIENPNSTTTKVTAIKSSSQISDSPIITPVCSEKFAVKSISPENKDGGVPRDSSILITFSKPIDFSSAKNKITITNSDGASLLSHYAEPILINGGTTLKYSALRDNPVITSGTVLVDVNIEEGITNSTGQELDSFSGYRFKLNSSYDNDAPTFVEFRIAKTKEELGLEDNSEQKLMGDSNTYEESEDYHIKDFVWIYCRAEDKGSGAYYLTANDKIIPPSYTDKTDDKTKNFVSTAENIYEFGPFKLDFPSEDYTDGKIDVEFKLYDYSDNECPDSQSYSFIRDTEINQDYVYLYNKFPNPETWFYPYATFSPLYDESSGYNKNYYSKTGFNGGRPYYNEDEFSSFYKKIYIDGLSDDNWLSQTSTITEKNNVSLYYTVSGVEYQSKYVESEYTKYFLLDKIDKTSDTLLRAVITDTVGNKKEVTTYLPTGGIIVNYGISSSYVSPVSTKSLLANADEVEFMYFYDFEWTDETETAFNSKNASTLSTINSLATNNSESSWVSKIDVNGWNESVAQKLMNLCNIEKGKRYIADFYTALNLDSISINLYGYGPSRNSTAVLSNINLPYNTVPYSSTNGNIDSKLDISQAYLGSATGITCYAVPRYKYTGGNTHYLYGAPIKENVTLGEISYSDSYTLDFTTTDVVSCGENSETCETSLENATITDSEGNECSDMFDLKYYYQSSGTTYSFYNPTITFPSALEEGKTYTVGIIATLKTDSSIIVKGSKEITLPLIDNYAPTPKVNAFYNYHTYNLFDYDKTGKNYYIDLQWFCCAYDSTSRKKTYSNINYLFDDRGSIALRNSTDSYDYEYYWIKYDSNSMSSELPTLKVDSEGNELFSYIRKGKSTFDWIYPLAQERNTGYKMWVPVYDMEDGHYVLAIKLADSNGNYLLKAVTYHDVETYKNLPEITLSGTTLTMKQTFGDQVYPSERTTWNNYRKNFIAGIQYFDNTGWKDIDLNLYLSDNNYSSYTTTKTGVNVAAANGKFLKCGIQAYQGNAGCYDQEREGRNSRGDYSSKSYTIDIFNGDINSYPVYKYVGTSTGSFHNLLDANGGITVFCDGPAFVHTLYSIKEDGYGSNINEWERRARELNPKQISASTNYTVSGLPDDAKSYVVIAYFDDGTSAISNVHKK